MEAIEGEAKGVILKECFSFFWTCVIILGVATLVHQCYLILILFHFKPCFKVNFMSNTIIYVGNWN